MYSSLFVSGQTDVEARAAEAGEALVKGYIAWRTKLSSPGASIQAKEIARAGSLVKYNLYVSERLRITHEPTLYTDELASRTAKTITHDAGP